MDISAFIINMFKCCVTMMFPLLVPSLGEAVSERAGIYNVGVEGFMLVGALFAYYATYLTHSLFLGLLAGMLAGGLLSIIHAFFSITIKANQIISGVGMWWLGMGLTAYLFRLIPIRDRIEGFTEIQVPVLAKIPVIGPILFQQNLLVYLGFFLVAIFHIFSNYTPGGTLIRATGDGPLAVDMAGHNVSLTRYISVLTCGVMSGLGGAYTSLVVLHQFSENMIAGRGFIALCIVIFGNWNPVRILLGALTFAMIDSFQLRMQAIGADIPYPLLLMAPFLITLIVLIGFGGNVEEPRKLTVPYHKGEE